MRRFAQVNARQLLRDFWTVNALRLAATCLEQMAARIAAIVFLETGEFIAGDFLRIVLVIFHVTLRLFDRGSMAAAAIFNFTAAATSRRSYSCGSSRPMVAS